MRYRRQALRGSIRSGNQSTFIADRLRECAGKLPSLAVVAVLLYRRVPGQAVVLHPDASTRFLPRVGDVFEPVAPDVAGNEVALIGIVTAIPFENVQSAWTAGNEIVAPGLFVDDDGGLAVSVGAEEREGTYECRPNSLESLRDYLIDISTISLTSLGAEK